MAKWEVNISKNVQIFDSGNKYHGNVLVLTPGGEFVRALIKDSAGWNKYRIKADFLFPKFEDNYLGLIYHYNTNEERVDFGSIDIKGNGSYIRMNPRRDYNANRTLHE